MIIRAQPLPFPLAQIGIAFGILMLLPGGRMAVPGDLRARTLSFTFGHRVGCFTMMRHCFLRCRV